MVQVLWKTGWFLKKLKRKLLFDLVTPFLGKYPKELKAGSERYLDTYIHNNIIYDRRKVEAA